MSGMRERELRWGFQVGDSKSNITLMVLLIVVTIVVLMRNGSDSGDKG